MTDKQIIIDGVDVSGCNFTLERDGKIKCECTHATGFGVICDCESWKTCDYKNYKRKEQECEELKSVRDSWMSKFEQETKIRELYQDGLDQLKAENEELTKYKSLFEKTRNLYNEARMNNYELLDEIKDLKDSIKRTICQSECYRYKEAEKLSQTLAEIKEVLQLYNNTTIGIDKGNGIFEFEVSNNNVLGGKLIYCYDTNPAKKALQKISEVENGI